MTALHDALPPLVDLSAWERDFAEHDDVELVAGFVTVSPSESADNLIANYLLCRLVDDGTDRAYLGVSHLDVVVSEVPATVRRPDVIVVRRGSLAGAKRAQASDVALVVEVVSPSTVETDWIVKRAEYARAGIPAYLVVDLREDVWRLALFTRPEAEGYVEAVGGPAVTLRLGEHEVPLTLADLLDS